MLQQSISMSLGQVLEHSTLGFLIPYSTIVDDRQRKYN